ncbi:MAG: hypothetical protein NZ602_05465 [Thermoguttaceae bacterium]|nr:hypothetical protein [Thermoguttaceae bacterium]MDW8036439.1 hypothetical protein [Thermoguttaceae bacterium]
MAKVELSAFSYRLGYLLQELGGWCLGVKIRYLLLFSYRLPTG